MKKKIFATEKCFFHSHVFSIKYKKKKKKKYEHLLFLFYQNSPALIILLLVLPANFISLFQACVYDRAGIGFSDRPFKVS